MSFKPKPTEDVTKLLKDIGEDTIASYYLHIDNIPTVINSPLRKDEKASFGIYSPDGVKVRYKDFSTGESGGIIDLIGKMYNLNFIDTLTLIINQLGKCSPNKIYIKKSSISMRSNAQYKSSISIQVKTREWEDYDIEYWSSYGITKQWLQWAEVYPISHKIINKDGKSYTFKADKYAYVYVERKESNISLKIYQPFNTGGYKWANNNDSSVIGLWTKVPPKGDKIYICSSLKDALCLSCNMKVPAVYIQGEGYSISNTAINELKKRYKQVYILLDNDPPGQKDAIKLSKETGFLNTVLPEFEGGKDISDYYYLYGKEKFIAYMDKVINPDKYMWSSECDDLPF